MPLSVRRYAISSGDFGTPTYNLGSEYVKIAVSSASASAIGKENATLALLKFKGIATGTTTLEIKSAELNDASGSLITPNNYTSNEVLVQDTATWRFKP